MILAIDAGNSRIKWGLHDGQDWQRLGAVETAAPENLEREWASIPCPQVIVAANVAGPEVARILTRLAAAWGLPPRWVEPEKERCGVRNGYSDPGQLGADRWIALIAAWNLFRRPCLVVNAGTAVTVDALSGEGRFLGGLIVPGLALMGKALAAHTAQLEFAAGSFQDFPRNTADAVFSGALQALAGAVERQAALLPGASCVLSGGDGRLLAERLCLPVIVVENLVLKGLVFWAQDRAT